MRINYFVGRKTGYKLTRTTYSRPSTLMVAKSKKQQLRVIEIGCAAGHNSLDILTTLNVAEFKAIDPYDTAADGYDDYSESRLALMERQARQRLRKHATKIDWIKKLSSDARADLQGKYDFIYIDGDHSYEAVKKDLYDYFDLVEEGGIIAGHDIDQQDVLLAFVEFIQEKKLKNFRIVDPDWIIFN